MVCVLVGNRVFEFAISVRETDYRIHSLKTTLLVDCKTGVIFHVHCSTNKPHDAPTGEQALKRNLDKLDVIADDNRDGVNSLRSVLRENDIRPQIKHRGFRSVRTAQNARLDEDLYNQRHIVEAVFRVLRKKYGASLWSRS